MGAYGLFDLLSRCPRFSTAIAIAGAGDPIFAPVMWRARRAAREEREMWSARRVYLKKKVDGAASRKGMASISVWKAEFLEQSVQFLRTSEVVFHPKPTSRKVSRTPCAHPHAPPSRARGTCHP